MPNIGILRFSVNYYIFRLCFDNLISYTFNSILTK